MPQPGVHAVLALATRKTFSRKRWFALGLVLGALIPDLDGYAQAYGFLVQGMSNTAAEAIYHRTLTHSLLFAGAMALVFYLLSLIRGNANLNYLGLGIATGIAVLHSFVDIFLWFDGVGLLWPFWQINLWGWLELPDIIFKQLRAANFLAFGWFLAYLLSIAKQANTDIEYLPRLRRYMYLQLGIGALFVVLAFILPGSLYNTIDGAVLLLWATPNVLLVSWRMRATIEAD